MKETPMANYTTSLLDNTLYCVTNGQFTRHLRSNGLTYREYYEKYVTSVEETCPYCSSPKTFYQRNHSYAKTCGSDACYGLLIKDIKAGFSDEKNAKINEKRAKTNLVKYGVKQNTANLEIKAKAQATRQQIMDDGRTKEEHIQEKARLGKLKKYGDINYNNRQKIRETKSNQSDEARKRIAEKRRNTNLERFGVACVFQLAENTRRVAKGNSSIKPYVLPSRRIIGIRGVENKALDALLEIYVESELRISNNYDLVNCRVPTFRYINVNHHAMIYYPDIYIPKENKIIEVKSRWWYDGNGSEKYKSRLENNQRKKQACISFGYEFEFWIYEINGRLTIIK
jgi:hypothetical protein